MSARYTGYLLLCFIFSFRFVQGQNVNVTATQGTASATYTNLSSAFTAINNAVHKGVIRVTVVNNTTESPFGAILQFSGYSLLTDYTKVTITTSGNWTVSGNVAPGQAVIQLNGADKVTINGTINAGNGGTRNLTIQNTSASTNSGVIWLKSQGPQAGCNNDSILNVNIVGNNATPLSTFGIFSAGSVISTTGAGSDNDSVCIRNNAISRAAYGIYYRCNATGPADLVDISNNILGSGTQSSYLILRGMDLQYLDSAVVSGNEVYNIIQSGTNHIAAIEAGNGVNYTVFQSNKIHDIVNLNSSYYGAYGFNISGTGNFFVNNMVYGVRAGSNSISSTQFNGFGIRLNSGNDHKFYYNSVHMSDTIPVAGINPGMSAAFCIVSTPLSGIDIRNNIFSNQMIGRVNLSRMYTMFVPNAFTFTGNTIDHNAYFIPPASTATTTYYVGSNLGFTYANLAAWAGYSHQDTFSVPASNQLAPFISASNLHINTSLAPLVIESSGILLPSWTRDFDNDIRQGAVGYSQNPSGSNPDIGADEVATLPPDFRGPRFDSIFVNPAVGGCNSVPHQVEAIIFDSSGVDTAVLRWTMNGLAQSDLPMVFTGTTWAGVIPAQGSAYITYWVVATDNSTNHNTSTSIVFGFQDRYLSANAGQDVNICIGDTVTLSGSTQYDGTPKITEVMLDRTALGVTPNIPAWATGPDLVEITNIGNIPVDLSGYSIHVAGGATANLTFPGNTILNDSAILIVHVGPGTDDPGHLYFNTGGLYNDLQSNEATGVWLKAPNGRIVDAVGVNSYSFTLATGVLAGDWQGNIPSAIGRAGVSRLGADNNRASGWVVADTNTHIQTIGSPNPGVPYNTSVSYFWSPGAISNPTLTVAPLGSTQYIFTVLDGICTQSDTVTVNVLQIPGNPVVTNDTVCGWDTLHLSVSGTGGTFVWYDSPAGTSIVGTGSVLSVIRQVTDTFWVEINNGACAGPRLAAIGVVNPAPAIQLSVSDTSICNGENVILQVSSANSAYSYTWSGSALSGSSGDSVSADPVSSAFYVVHADDSVCHAIDSVGIHVNPVPNVFASATNPTHCIGDSSLLSVLVNQQYTSADSFGTNTPVAIPDNNASGAVSVINVSGLTSLTMTDSSIVSVRLNITHPRDGDILAWLVSPAGDSIRLFANLGINAPNYTNTSFSPSATTNIFFGFAPFTGNWFPQGPGTFSTFTGTNPNGNWYLRVIDSNPLNTGTLTSWSITFRDLNPITYSWSVAGGSAFSSSPSVMVNPATTTLYMISVADSVTGCAGTDTQTVNVNLPLDAHPLAPVGICIFATDTLFASATGGDGNYSYTWNPGALPGDTLLLTLTQDTMIYLTVTDGCGTPANTDSVFVPTAGNVTALTGNDTTACSGAPLVLTATGVGGDGNYSYIWSSGGTAATDTVTDTLSATYTVTIVDGCGTWDDDTVVVNIFAPPTVLAPPDTLICEGLSITLIAQYTVDAAPAQFQWTPVPSSTDTLVVTPTQTTSYVVTLTDACGLSASDYTDVTLDPLPVAGFSWTPGSGAGQIQFANLSQHGTTYAWSFGDGQTSTLQNPMHTFGATGNYPVRLIATNACGSDTITQSVTIQIVNGTEAEAGERTAELWPNPNRGQFRVGFAARPGENARLRLIDIHGALIYEKQVDVTASWQEENIVPDAVSKGVYFLEVISSARKESLKVVVQ